MKTWGVRSKLSELVLLTLLGFVCGLSNNYDYGEFRFGGFLKKYSELKYSV